MNPLAAALAPPAGATALAVAYSGGLDSTVLLHLLAGERPAGLPLRALHVCHHLHAEAQAWARHCERFCDALGMTCVRLDVQVDQTGAGPEAAARTARYAALAGALAPGEYVVSAHHARDQAETLLLQALRGAGVAGLAAMPTQTPLGQGGLWRPWLAIDRGAIEAYAARQGLDWIEDDSNTDPAYDRNYLRTRVWPVLTERWPAAARTLSRSAQHAAIAGDALHARAMADLDAACVGTDGGLSIARLRQWPGARQAEVVRCWLARARLDTPDHRHVAAIIGLCEARDGAPAWVRFGATQVRRFAGRLYAMPRLPVICPGPTHWDLRQPLTLPGPGGHLLAHPVPAGAPSVEVVYRRGGERVAWPGTGHRALKDVLRERRVATWLRDRTPLIRCADEIVAVADVWYHPRLAVLLGVGRVRFEWRGAPAGADARVVAPPAFG